MDRLHFDLRGGICGDMILGALTDLGVPFETLCGQIHRLGLPGLSLRHRLVRRGTVDVAKIDVITRREHAHRNLAMILSIIDRSALPSQVKELSSAIFTRLARAEADVHGTTTEEVHFHEVGALDAIADIVGASICVDFLSPRQVTADPFHFGTGSIRCAHGLLDVPVPAVRALTRGHPVVRTQVEGEMVTPTGAAVLVTLLDLFGEPGQAHEQHKRPDRIGRAAGDREYSSSRGFLEVHAFVTRPDR